MSADDVKDDPIKSDFWSLNNIKTIVFTIIILREIKRVPKSETIV